VVISGHQWSSEARTTSTTVRFISSHQWSSVVIRGTHHLYDGPVISGHQWSSVVIRGTHHLYDGPVISGHQWSSVVIRGTHHLYDGPSQRIARDDALEHHGRVARARRWAVNVVEEGGVNVVICRRAV
jgi:nitroimidazol reductase NimA-like FMN-containing flavoprotein (pyridoxamine 5'-phosphate oxidase superfamily)